MTVRHRCVDCGASCEGLRVRVQPARREQLREHARQLGVERPLSGPWLRQNWGRCVFWRDGCRLHAELGWDAKPLACRQFPFVFADDAVGLDPACRHADPDPEGSPAERHLPRGVPAQPVEGELSWDDLAVGEQTADRLAALPLRAVIEGPHLGPLTRQTLAELEGASPAVPVGVDRQRLDARARTVLELGLAPRQGLRMLVVGGGQLVVGAGLPIGAGYAAWVRLLRTGVV